MSLFVAGLFFVLTPGILVSLPPKGSKYTVALVHGLVFAVIFHLTHKLVWNALYGDKKEGFAYFRIPDEVFQQNRDPRAQSYIARPKNKWAPRYTLQEYNRF